MALVVSRAQPERAWVTMAAAPWWVFAAPMTLMLGNSLLHAWRLRLVLPNPPPFSSVLRVVLVSNFFGLFLPTGGADVARAVGFNRGGQPLDTTLAALATVRLLELAPWATLLVYAAVFVLPGGWPHAVPIAWAFAIAILGVLVCIPLATPIPQSLLLRLPVPALIRRAVGFRAPAARLIGCLTLAYGFAIVNTTVVWVILRGYGISLGWNTVLGLVPTADILIALPITVSGAGVREGVFIWLLGAKGVVAPVALAVALTRWTGEWARSAVGGLLFVTGESRDRSTTVTNG